MLSESVVASAFVPCLQLQLRTEQGPDANHYQECLLKTRHSMLVKLQRCLFTRGVWQLVPSPGFGKRQHNGQNLLVTCWHTCGC